MSQLLITNDKLSALGFHALPTSAQLTGGFGFLHGNTMPLYFKNSPITLNRKGAMRIKTRKKVSKKFHSLL